MNNKKNWDEMSDEEKRSYLNYVNSQKEEVKQQRRKVDGFVVVVGTLLALFIMIVFLGDFFAGAFLGKESDISQYTGIARFIFLLLIILFIFSRIKYRKVNFDKAAKRDGIVDNRIVNSQPTYLNKVIGDSNSVSKGSYEHMESEIITKDKNSIFSLDNITKFYSDNKNKVIKYIINRIIFYVCLINVILIFFPFFEYVTIRLGIYDFLFMTSTISLIVMIITYEIGKELYKKMEHYYSYNIIDISSYTSFEYGYLFKDFLSYVIKYVLFKKKNR